MELDYKKITEELIPIFEEAGQMSIDLFNKGLKVEIKLIEKLYKRALNITANPPI